MNQRELALEILYKTIKEESYSNLLMRSELNKISPVKRPFVTNLVNGVLRNYEFLSFQFEDQIEQKTSLRCRLILCMALFERFYFHEKDYVVNNEYVELAANRYEKSFVNALLHKIKYLNPANEEYIRYSLPEWIYKLLKAQYEEDDLLKIMEVYHRIPQTCYRINRKKCDRKMLEGYNIEFIDDDVFRSSSNLLNSDLYKEGCFYVQDGNSASLYRHLDLKESDTLLDVCCAPGSKLFNCLDIVAQENVYGNDLHASRVELIRKMGKKLGYEKFHLSNYDGRELKDKLNVIFDKILLDAPCSGLGVIGRKPDLKFHIRPQSLDELQKLQLELLESMIPLLKKEGILLYSTCTLNKKENRKLVDSFLKKHDDHILLEDDTIINDIGDCFYYAKIKKVS